MVSFFQIVFAQAFEPMPVIPANRLLAPAKDKHDLAA
jgi:hypothetical protein